MAFFDYWIRIHPAVQGPIQSELASLDVLLQTAYGACISKYQGRYPAEDGKNKVRCYGPRPRLEAYLTSLCAAEILLSWEEDLETIWKVSDENQS